MYRLSTIDEHSTHFGIGGDDFEGFFDLIGSSAATYVQEVGRLAAVEFDDIHCGHGETSAVHQTADTSCNGE